jgi:hypothetical protein
MIEKWKRRYSKRGLTHLIFATLAFLAVPHDNLLAAGGAAGTEATEATAEMLASLNSSVNKDDRWIESEVNRGIKALQSDESGFAITILQKSVQSIKVVFKDEPSAYNSEENLLRTVKQTACVFVAETHYGNLGHQFDQCDQTNIGQIRPPAYAAIYKDCQFAPNELAFLGKGTTCETLHPYELPPCCGQQKMKSCTKGNPPQCIGEEKRKFLIAENQMVNGENWTDGVSAPGGAVLDPIKCKSTTGKTYYRVPAIPEHSVFASIYYLKLVGFKPMTDAQFGSFAANKYNGAGSRERAAYQAKLNSCLALMNKNNDLIKKSLNKIASIQTPRTNAVSDRKAVRSKKTNSVGSRVEDEDQQSQPGAGSR